jgi:hypothetical protein
MNLTNDVEQDVIDLANERGALLNERSFMEMFDLIRGLVDGMSFDIVYEILDLRNSVTELAAFAIILRRKLEKEYKLHQDSIFGDW